MSFSEYIGGQCSKPTGIGGKIITKGMNFLNSEHYRAVAKYVCKNDGARILDIGFGNGKMLQILDKKLSAKLYGIDISEDMIEKATETNSDAVNLNRMILQNAKASDLPYNDEFFDTVYTINTIYFWEDVDKVFEEVRRVLKNGGNFVCTFYSREALDKLAYCNSGFAKFTPSEVRSMAREFGFHNVKVKILKDNVAFCLLAEKIEGV